MDENALLLAEKLAQGEVDAGIERVRKLLPVQPLDFDGYCVDCGDLIPEGRVKFGAITCVTCQSLRERKSAITRH